MVKDPIFTVHSLLSKTQVKSIVQKKNVKYGVFSFYVKVVN